MKGTDSVFLRALLRNTLAPNKCSLIVKSSILFIYLLYIRFFT